MIRIQKNIPIIIQIINIIKNPKSIIEAVNEIIDEVLFLFLIS